MATRKHGGHVLKVGEGRKEGRQEGRKERGKRKEGRCRKERR